MFSLKQATFKYWIKIYCYNNAFIRLIKHNIKCELLSNMMLLVCSPYILFNYWFCCFNYIYFHFIYSSKSLLS